MFLSGYLISTKVSREHNKWEKRSFVHKATWPFAWMHTEHFNKNILKGVIQQSYSTTKERALSGHTVNSVGIYTRQYPISLREISPSELCELYKQST